MVQLEVKIKHLFYSNTDYEGVISPNGEQKSRLFYLILEMSNLKWKYFKFKSSNLVLISYAKIDFKATQGREDRFWALERVSSRTNALKLANWRGG